MGEKREKRRSAFVCLWGGESARRDFEFVGNLLKPINSQLTVPRRKREEEREEERKNEIGSRCEMGQKKPRRERRGK